MFALKGREGQSRFVCRRGPSHGGHQAQSRRGCKRARQPRRSRRPKCSQEATGALRAKGAMLRLVFLRVEPERACTMSEYNGAKELVLGGCEGCSREECVWGHKGESFKARRRRRVTWKLQPRRPRKRKGLGLLRSMLSHQVEELRPRRPC